MDANQVNELELFQPADQHLATVPSAGLAEIVARTEFAPAEFRGKPGAVLAAMLTGHELDLSPMTSLASIHIINGKPALSAELQRALILREGHGFQVVESTSSRCTVRGWRREHGPEMSTTVTWSMDDARAAGLDKNPTYRKFPRAMLLARASSELARSTFPDVIKGLASAEEAETADIEEAHTAKAPTTKKVKADLPKAPEVRRPAVEATVVEDQDVPPSFTAPPVPVDATIVDDVDDEDDEPVEDDVVEVHEHDLTPAQRIAIAARTADPPIDRKAVALHVSDGRTGRASELHVDEVRAALACIDDLKAGRYVITDGTVTPAAADPAPEVRGEAESSPDPVAVGTEPADLVDPNEPTFDELLEEPPGPDSTIEIPEDVAQWDQADWLRHLKGRRIRLGDATRESIALAIDAESFTGQPGQTIAQNTADPAVAAALYRWTLDQ